MGAEGRATEAQLNGFAGRVEVIEGPSGRRRWPDDVKARIVRESLEPGVSVSEVARRHRISPQVAVVIRTLTTCPPRPRRNWPRMRMT